MALSQIGQVAHDFWSQIPSHFPNAKLDVFQVMPNHIHGIIILSGDLITARNSYSINDNDGDRKKNEYFKEITPKAGSISTIIRSYKSSCSKHINLITPDHGFFWQPRYYDHIIRNNEEYFRIKNYIINNPKHWKQDKFFNERNF